MNDLEIKDYYDQLAQDYDDQRFNNSYGKYLDRQEKKFLHDYLHKAEPPKDWKVLDVGCGTGRLLEYATHGIDFSPEMLKVAQQKFPEKNLQLGDLTELPFADGSLDLIFCFHVIMHQDLKTTQQFIEQAYQKLKVGGRLIFDFPSSKRRLRVKHQQKNWHAANQMAIEDIYKMTEKSWELLSYQGFLFLPIHRMPAKYRKKFIVLDTIFCHSPLKEYASYLAVILEKK